MSHVKLSICTHTFVVMSVLCIIKIRNTKKSLIEEEEGGTVGDNTKDDGIKTEKVFQCIYFTNRYL